MSPVSVLFAGIVRRARHGLYEEALSSGQGAAIPDEVPQRSSSQGQGHR